MADPRRAEVARPLEPAGVRVDADDLRRAGDSRALDNELADAARADDERGLAGLEPRRVTHGADAGERGAAQQGGFLERHVLIERQRRLRREDDVLGKAAGRGHPVDGLAVERHARGSVEEGAGGDRGAKRLARGGAAAAAGPALAAAGRPRDDDAVAWM